MIPGDEWKEGADEDPMEALNKSTPRDYYKLNEKGEPIKCASMIEWAMWYEKNRWERVVKQTRVRGCLISTVFLGLDHNWCGGPPILWETMVFGRNLDKECERCPGSREQAETMHARQVRLVIENHPWELKIWIADQFEIAAVWLASAVHNWKTKRGLKPR